MAKTTRRGSGGGGGSGGLSGISLHELRRELSNRQRRAAALHRQRTKLLERLAELDAALAGTGMTMAGGTGLRRRPKNDSNLVEALQKLLTGKTLSVTAAAEEVQKAGYMSTSPNFRTIVNQALINSKKFKRVGRGLYTSK